MKLVTYDAGAGPRAGVQTGDGIVDAGFATVGKLLRSDALGKLAGLEGEPVAGARLLPPVTDPEKLICIGLNYRSHAEEQGAEPPATPTFFAKFANALAPPGATVELPAWSGKVDYEAEVAFGIGGRRKDGPVQAPLDFRAGSKLVS